MKRFDVDARPWLLAEVIAPSPEEAAQAWYELLEALEPEGEFIQGLNARFAMEGKPYRIAGPCGFQVEEDDDPAADPSGNDLESFVVMGGLDGLAGGLIDGPFYDRPEAEARAASWLRQQGGGCWAEVEPVEQATEEESEAQPAEPEPPTCLNGGECVDDGRGECRTCGGPVLSTIQPGMKCRVATDDPADRPQHNLAALPNGTEGEVANLCGRWVRVDFGGKIGIVNALILAMEFEVSEGVWFRFS